MLGDIKDVVGILMRVLDGGEVSPAELEDLVFDAEGELEAALSAAFIKLQEFAYDRDLRRNDPALDRVMRAELVLRGSSRSARRTRFRAAKFITGSACWNFEGTISINGISRYFRPALNLLTP
jgi:hypothetical protein